jgi:TonB family protein
MRGAVSRVYHHRDPIGQGRDRGSRTHRKRAHMSLTVQTFEPTRAAPSPVPAARKPLTPHWSRVAAAGVALMLNALAISGLAHLRAVDAGAAAEPDRVEAWLIPEAEKANLPAPEPAPIAMKVELDPPEIPPAVMDDAAGMAHFAPPRMDADSSPDFTEFSRAVKLAGAMATVVILVDVDARGRVTNAVVVRSTGDHGTDEAALAYARQTRWIPGNIGGTPRDMQASLTLVFGLGDQYDSRPPPAVSASG